MPKTLKGDPLLTVRNLHVQGQAANTWCTIVEGIELDVARGEILGIIGELGAGKSTLGLAAMGFRRDGCRFLTGSVLFDGLELIAAPAALRRKLRSSRIAYVAQSAAASFNPAYRLVSQYIEFPVLRGLMSRAEAKQDAIEMYRKLYLPKPEEIGFRFPHQVSGGQLQRAMTAMAMACRPDLIIFDEPTTALDVTTQIEVLAAIRDAVETFGTSAIYISHDLAVVAQMADRVMVLRRGHLVEEASTRTMLAAPREPYTKTLWAVRTFRSEAKPGIQPSAMPLCTLERIVAAYGSATILQGVSFAVHRGRTMAVVGESGSGKSTAARCIMGLLTPVSGTVRFHDRVLPAHFRKRTKEDLRQIQMIYQMADTALNPRQRVREIIGRPISFYLGLSGPALRRRIEELLAQIELDPKSFMDRFPGELSGGQKQRIGIARALAAEPQLIICDEVTSALDQIVAEGILRLLARLQQSLGLAYLLITHDIATVRAVADEIVVMKDGQVVETGAKEVVLDSPAHPYTERLLASVPEMDPDWLTNLRTHRHADR